MFPRASAVSRLGTAVPCAALLLIAVLLLFPRLDDRYLWEDEAETALLATNVLRFGVPVAWDGRDLVSQECGLDHDENYLWRHTPWLPIYLAAGSFRLLGVSTLAARLPFVILGLIALPSLYLLGRLVFRARAVALLAVVILVLSVPFLLHVRQARYYAPAMLATIWLLVAFFRTLEGRRFAVAGLVIAATLLFHSSYLIAAATLGGLLASLAVLRPARSALAWLAVAAGVALVVNAPWFAILDLGTKADVARGLASGRGILEGLGRYAAAVELYAFPSLLLVPALVWSVWRRAPRGGKHPHPRGGKHPYPMATVPGARLAAGLAVVIAVQIVILAFTPVVFYRYFVNLLPAFALLTAWIVWTVARRSLVVATVVLLTVVLVDRADAIRLQPGSTLLKYVDEITHDFEGPIEALVTYLRKTAGPGDRVFATYGALALRFHTGLEVRGGTGCQDLAGWAAPEWLVVRYFLRLNPVWGPAWVDTERTVRYLNARLATPAYRHIELAAVDIVHDAIPEPDLHVYRTPRHGRPVTLFRRLAAGPEGWEARPPEGWEPRPPESRRSGP